MNMYLVDVEPPTTAVELGVERVEHANNLKGRGCGADWRETHQITEQHCDVIHLPGTHALT